MNRVVRIFNLSGKLAAAAAKVIVNNTKLALPISLLFSFAAYGVELMPVADAMEEGIASFPAVSEESAPAAEAGVLPGPVEVQVDESGLRHIIAGNRVDAAWGEGCVDADASWAGARLHLMLTSGRGEELGDGLLQDLEAIKLVADAIPYILLWDEDGNVLLDQEMDARPPTMADLHKTMLFLNVPQNARRELEGLDAHARAVLDAYVDGFNECFHRDEAKWINAFTFVSDYGLIEKDLTAFEVLARVNYFWAWGQILEIREVIKQVAANPERRPSVLELPIVDYEGSSNEWYIAGAHMADGKTVHATDPHIPITMPGAYGLTFRSVVGRFAGAGLIGVPGMLIGATTSDRGNVAWTTTAAGPDGSDLFDVETIDGGSGYVTSGNGIEQFKYESFPVGDEIFTLRSGRYGTVFLKHPTANRIVSLKSITEEPLRTFEWSLLMDEASNIDELRDALTLPGGKPWGVHGLNILASSNPARGSDAIETFFGLLAVTPKRIGDTNKMQKYTGVLDARDPRYEWTKEFYKLDELPQSYDPPNGYAANCNVSPSVTDPRIGNDFPLSIIYSKQDITTYRQQSFENRIEELVDSGPVMLDQLLDFATDSRATHWEMTIDVLLESYLLYGDPLGVLEGNDPFADTDTIPLPYQLLVNLIYMRYNDGIRADDSHAGALMHVYINNLHKAAAEAADAEVIQLAAGGRPVSFEAFSSIESARLAFQVFFDTVNWFLATFKEQQPTLADIQKHFFFDGAGQVTTAGAPGGAGSFRTTSASGFYQLSRLGDPGDVEILLIKPYTTWDPYESLGPVMANRFAKYEFTQVAIPPVIKVRRIVR
jgi:hypothetical protein